MQKTQTAGRGERREKAQGSRDPKQLKEEKKERRLDTGETQAAGKEERREKVEGRRDPKQLQEEKEGKIQCKSKAGKEEGKK